ncbi:MAG: SNF2 helicase associated domain-containing protein, partial [Desulfovibrionales bacterium]
MIQVEENTVKTLLKEFIQENIPEYILDGSRSILTNDGVQKIDIKKRDNYWDVEGHIQGEDFQIYNSEIGLNLGGGTVNFFCNCPDSFSGVCRHIGATMLKLKSSLETDETEEVHKPRSDWRQSFRSFFSTEPEPEPGEHYLIFRLFPEPERLQVAFFRARQNKSGLSTVQNEVTLEQIINNPNWCEISPQLPNVAEQIGQYIDYHGHRVEIPPGLLNWFLWSIKNEFYLFLEETEQPVRIESKTMRLQLSPHLSEDGLNLDIMLGREGKVPINIKGEGVYFYGRMPLWVYWKNSLYPVQTGLNSRLIQEMVKESPAIPHGEISEFLDRVWTKIPSSDLYGQEEFLERMKPIFATATYNPKLFLDEEGSLLTLQISNIYWTEHAEISLPGPNPDLQTGSYQFEGKSFLIRRSQEEESKLVNLLMDMGFQSRNNATWFLEPEEAITFLLDHYPSLVETYRVYGEKNLTRYKVRLTPPTVMAEVKSEDKQGKWFDLDIQVEYGDVKVPIEKIWKAWIQGKRYVQLKDGSYTSLPESWLKRLGHKLEAMG